MQYRLLTVIFAIVCAADCAALDPVDDLLAKLQSTQMDAVLYWNFVTLQAAANDFDRSVVFFPDQFGPAYAARAFAMIHGAMYDAVAVFTKAFKPVFASNNLPNICNVDNKSAVDAAVMEAAYQTLRVLYMKQQAIFDAVRQQYLRQLKANGKKQDDINAGICVGQLIATLIFTDRQNDGIQIKIPYAPTMIPGYHQADPTHPNQGFVTPNWDIVKPFFLDSASQFRSSNFIGDTPATRQKYLNSSRYIKDFNEVKALGAKNSIIRTDDQTEIGQFWAYDGLTKVGTTPRVYNQVVRVIAIQQKNSLGENARLFALINYAMADIGIAVIDCKYHYNFWRPIVAIRQAIGVTQADPNWLPLGSPSDSNSTNFTPPLSSYVSGHAALAGSVFELLRLFYKRDNIKFQFQSDEYNGQTFDSITGQVRPARTRCYRSFSHAEEEASLSRIYLGIHWRIDQEEGIVLGRKVGQWVFKKLC